MFQLDDNSTSVSEFNATAVTFFGILVGSAPYSGTQQSWAANQSVSKIGAYGGPSSGVITNTCFNQLVGTEWLVCQIVATYSHTGGDSGSPVWSNIDGGRWIMGMHWGHTVDTNRAIFSYWGYAQSELANDILAHTGQLWLPAFTTGPAHY